MTREQIEQLKTLMRVFKKSKSSEYREINKATLLAYLDGVLDGISDSVSVYEAAE